MIINNLIPIVEMNKKKYINDVIESKKIFGFWLYLISDCILFATMFSVYFVMVNNTADGPTGKDIFKLSFILLETILLLFSTISYGLVKISVYQNRLMNTVIFLFITFFFGLGFIGLEFFEFYSLIKKGYGPSRSGFLSAFFTLVATHGIHVFFGVFWVLVMICQIIKFGISKTTYIRILCLGLFWHFLDLVWICLFTFVYLICFL
ncbi:cytochrome o ubiquinol oxidase subunit III [Buchnera aphidicola]|uniref:cytochrome o ubiquinol oxidase subunit III n=1 Tax=Buchnera aphidicola TaxID=9 RepID=UPI003463C412